VAHESGVANTVDPLAGSYFVESLTNEIERQATTLIEQVDSLGGAERAIAAGFFQEEIARSAYAHQLRVEAGETVVVGVNRFEDDAEALSIPTPDFSALEREQVARVRAVRASRDARRADDALAALREAAPAYADPSAAAARPPLMPLIVDAVRARATVGEISDTLRSVWGEYRPS
jgi:methylmalonyl-CoA mutase N-terminal domain/subunit